MDDIGFEIYPLSAKLVEAGHPHFENIVTWYRNAEHQFLRVAIWSFLPVILELSWSNNMDLVSLFTQPGNKAVECHGNTIYLRWEGFGNQADFHSEWVARIETHMT